MIKMHSFELIIWPLYQFSGFSPQTREQILVTSLLKIIIIIIILFVFVFNDNID
jgi:hypothetical protein